jgi:hypothetical protein
VTIRYSPVLPASATAIAAAACVYINANTATLTAYPLSEAASQPTLSQRDCCGRDVAATTASMSTTTASCAAVAARTAPCEREQGVLRASSWDPGVPGLGLHYGNTVRSNMTAKATN